MPRARGPRRAVTGRALVLGTVVVLLLVLLASPLSRYFGSRSAVSSQGQQLVKDRQQLRELKAQQKRWGDPGYIQQQARTTLMYAMPGDTVYVVVDKGQRNDIDKTAVDPQAGKTPASWNTKLWGSVERASSGS